MFLEKRTDISSEKNNKYLIEVLNKVLNSEYIENKYKEKLEKKFANLLAKIKHKMI